jgi:phosphoserine aminotransferase
MKQPDNKPLNPLFCSGPCAKIPTWNAGILSNAMVGRSHRSKDGQAAIKSMLDKTKSVLEIPSDYQIALTPGSATGSITMAMWNFLGARPIDMLVWDVFGKRWKNDVKNLNLTPNVYEAPFGEMPDVSNVNSDNDLMFVWNATSTGTTIANMDWYTPGDGLTICDATSSAFCVKLPWQKLDITCFSWQKGMGGEAAHGLIVLSPKAIERLKNYTPKWPIPYMLNLKNSSGIRTDLFEGVVINTPSMLCLEDYMQSLSWAEQNGGLDFLTSRTQKNYDTINSWMQSRPWTQALVKDEKYRSTVNSCIRILKNGTPIDDASILNIAQILSKENVAFDIKGFKGTPSNIRIWTGPTVETANIEILLDWLDWVHAEYLQ